MDVQLVNREVKCLAEQEGIQEVAQSKKQFTSLGEEFEAEPNFVRINSKSFRHSSCVRAMRNGISLGMINN